MTNDQRLIVASVPGDRLIKRILKIKYCITVKIYSADKTPTHTGGRRTSHGVKVPAHNKQAICDRSHEQIQLLINETTLKQYTKVLSVAM